MSEADALIAAQGARVPLCAYRCERCDRFHLTSRTKRKRLVAMRFPSTD